MTWDEYKALCDRPDVFSRWMVERTAEVLGESTSLSERLRPVAHGGALVKPDGHKGGPETDMFVLHLDVDTVAEIVATLTARRDAGARTPSGRSLGGFVEAWQEYLEMLP